MNILKAAKALGSNGGRKSSDAMTKEQRIERAKKAAAKRWEKKGEQLTSTP